jgi:hypothetical protein
MRYSVNLRLKNPGPAKYLVDTREAEDLPSAFKAGDELIATMDIKEHLIEIVDSSTNEVVASFNEEE